MLGGLRAQLERRREALELGASPIGWKIGLNDPRVQEHLGLDRPVIGFLTDGTLAAPGETHSLAGATRPAAEAEIAVELRRDVGPGAEVDEALGAIESLGPAVEIVDLDRPLDDLEAILAANVFHRAVCLGQSRQDVAVSGVEVQVWLNGDLRHTARADVDLAGTIRLVADLLGPCGEPLRAGQRIIAGALTPVVPLAAGDELECDFGPLGRIGLRFEV